jgi:hypothetical protein
MSSYHPAFDVLSFEIYFVLGFRSKKLLGSKKTCSKFWCREWIFRGKEKKGGGLQSKSKALVWSGGWIFALFWELKLFFALFFEELCKTRERV